MTRRAAIPALSLVAGLLWAACANAAELVNEPFVGAAFSPEVWALVREGTQMLSIEETGGRHWARFAAQSQGGARSRCGLATRLVFENAAYTLRLRFLQKPEEWNPYGVIFSHGKLWQADVLRDGKMHLSTTGEDGFKARWECPCPPGREYLLEVRNEAARVAVTLRDAGGAVLAESGWKPHTNAAMSSPLSFSVSARQDTVAVSMTDFRIEGDASLVTRPAAPRPVSPAARPETPGTGELEGPTLAPDLPDDIKPRRPIVLSRTQTMYALHQNYYLLYDDRPLFQDSGLRAEGAAETFTRAGFLRDAEIAAGLYEMDGLATSVGAPWQFEGYFRAADFLEQGGLKNFLWVPELTGGQTPIPAAIDQYDKVIKRALASPNSLQLGGRLVIPSYCVDAWSFGQLAEVVTALRRRNENRVLFIANAPSIDHLLSQAYRDGRIAPDVIERAKAMIRRYLDLCDGIQGIAYVDREDDSGFGRKLDLEYYTKWALPVYQQVLAEPKYARKLLALFARAQYASDRRGVVHATADGTRRLRLSLQAALDAKADIIMLPEWNEFKENTCIQPTLYTSLGHQRILKHYMRALKGLPPAPNAGDDPSVPNLVVSYRPNLKLGERLEVELLNVPESRTQAAYTAQLVLRDFGGRLVREFPEVSFAAGNLEDRTFALPTEDISQHRLLTLAVRITTPDGRRTLYGEGLHPIAVRSTWNTDHKCVKQPLRDIPAGVASTLTILPPEEGQPGHLVRGSFACAEGLASLEVLEDEREVFAYDRTRNDDPDRLWVTAKFGSVPTRALRGEIALAGVSAFEFVRGRHPQRDFPQSHRVEGNRVAFDAVVNNKGHYAYLAIPRRDAERASIRLLLNGVSFDVIPSALARDGMYAKSLGAQCYVVLDALSAAADIPPHIGSRPAEFSFHARPSTATPVYRLRAVTASGKIYHSRPVLPPAPRVATPDRASGVTDLAFFSYTEKRPLTVRVNAADVPDLVYVFDRRCGDILPCAAGPRWYGELGGGVLYAEPYNRKANYPDAVAQSAPAWTLDEDRPCLHFDGKGTYVSFAQETMPRGSFSLVGDIKPLTAKNQVLFRSTGESAGALTVKIRSGRL